MSDPRRFPTFQSALASLFEAFLRDKRARGYGCAREEYHLRRLDRFAVEAGLEEQELPRDLVEGWLSQTTHRRPSTHYHRQIFVRQLAVFLQSRGCSAYRLPLTTKCPKAYVTARVFSREEIHALLQAADRLPFNPRSPVRHLVMPTLFHVLYGCGLRVGEALRLVVTDVDLQAGILRIQQGKFRKDRLVPVAPGLLRRLQKYADALGPRPPEEPFFPSPRGGPYGYRTIYHTFRQLLRAVGIAHGGRGRGPRLHEIRHAFAVHRLEAWYRSGEDLNAKLPLLATYLGHQSMLGTQWYLQLTRTLFTDIAVRLEDAYGHAIPGEVEAP